MDLSAYTTDVDGLLAQSLLAWRPPRRLRLSEWADAYLYLSPESAAEPGKWHTLPYQRGVMDAISDPDVMQVTWMKSSRIGYTKAIGAAIGFYIHQDPCPIMVVQPTIEDAEGYSKEEIAPMLRDCPVLAAAIPEPKAKDSGNTILHKRFLGGGLSIVGANSPRGFRRVSRRAVFFDETDGYPPSAGTEGDPIQLGIRRTEYYWNRKIVAGSTPTVAGYSRIEQLFFEGDQRRYYVPCPHCGEMQVLQFTRFRWPEGKPAQAVYVCYTCGAEIEHRHKRAMVIAGEWRPGPHLQFPDIHAPAPFAGHASFHLWAAYSFSPNATWGQLCTEFVRAKREGVEHLKTYVNTVLGETWQERGEAPDWERLYWRREMYAIGTVPRGALFLTCGVDVQKDRLIYEVVGWGRGKTSWSIDAGILPGDTSDTTARGPWPKLDALLERSYPHADGAQLPVSRLAIDAGAFTQTVYGWAKGHPMSRVMAVHGVESAKVLVGSPTPVEITQRGRKLKRGYKTWAVATNVAKSELYGFLGLPMPTDEQRAAGETEAPGFCHFPEYGDEYFKQLTAEHLVTSRSPRGYIVMAWKVLPGRENHFLDCRNYARAAAFVEGLDRMQDGDWARLERALGVKFGIEAAPPAQEPTTEPRTPGTAEPQHAPATPPHPTAKRGWLGQRRRGGWLKGGR